VVPRRQIHFDAVGIAAPAASANVRPLAHGTEEHAGCTRMRARIDENPIDTDRGHNFIARGPLLLFENDFTLERASWSPVQARHFRSACHPCEVA
jgi:hypothetical protein